AQDLDLQGFLGPEVREEAALGKAQLLGQMADADALQAVAAGQGGGPLQDGLAGQLSLSHPFIIARSFVLSSPSPSPAGGLASPRSSRRCRRDASCSTPRRRRGPRPGGGRGRR